jgi:transcriptional regulator with XRE-family HTH domain
VDSATIIVRARQGSGLSQRELARRAGTSAAAVCLYESGQRTPRTDTFTRLIAACGAQLDVSLAMRGEAIDLEANGRALESVLELAQQLPARPNRTLDAPVLARLVEAS